MVLGSGCLPRVSYPADKLKDAIAEICRKEYGIENVDVKVVGQTLGVYLPLKKLFSADFKEAAVTGKVRNLESLFEPSPEALEKVEDVLFAISRVILSTDRPLDFYILQATDTEKTGMQLNLFGYINDIKRVRVSDISRSEYRKRVVHELKLNRAVLWHKPVRLFFNDLGELPIHDIQKKYFGERLTDEALQNLFYNSLQTGIKGKPRTRWNILDIRSTSVNKTEALVYAEVEPMLGEKEEKALRYLFLVGLGEEEPRIIRIIPFQYQDKDGLTHRVRLPAELRIDENLDRWDREFSLEEMKLGPFLALQLSRRMQAMMAGDERIQNTFREIKLNFDYHEDSQRPYFSLDIEAVLKDFNNYKKGSLVFHEDMIYLLNLASREFVEVLRSYQFGDYDYLRLNLAQDPAQWILGREDLELFRKKKIDLQGLLSVPHL